MTQQPTNVSEFLLHGKDGDHTALEFLRERFSYADLRQRVDQVAGAVLAIGGKKGDRAVLVGENSFFFVSSYLGILRAGLVCVPLSASIEVRELNEVLRITDAKLLFQERDYSARDVVAAHGVRVITPHCIHAAEALSPARFPSVTGDDLAVLMFTSGSTGKPRGVMISHRNIISNTESIIEYLRLTSADRIMVVLPFYYCFGASLLHTHLRVGGSLVVDSRFMYPETVLQRMIQTNCTGFAGVPSHFQLLLRNSSLRKKRFPRLRCVQQAGGHLAPAFVEQLSSALPDTQVFVMYGQTEATARLSYLPPECLPAKLGSIGCGIPGVSLRVVNEAGIDVLPGEIGEIVARGPNVARGYWREPKETAAIFRDGALYTGDLATVDADGFVYIVDRAKDFLKCGGERVSCRYIEDALLGCEELLEAAVIGVPDEVLGESPKAFVVPLSPADPALVDRLTSFCKARLSSRIVPKQVIVLGALPKSTGGKVLKAALRSL